MKVVANVLIAIGVLLIGYVAYTFIQASRFQSAQEQAFTAHLNPPATAATPTPALPDPREGEIMGRLEIPRLGLSVMVVEGDDFDDLKRAAGHIPGTALPGRPGNVGIAAHRDTYFRPLRGIHDGDAITVDTLHGTYQYQVVSTKIVGPNDNQVLAPAGRDVLTLVTCYPFYYIGPAPKRFIVQAERVTGEGLIAADARR